MKTTQPLSDTTTSYYIKLHQKAIDSGATIHEGPFLTRGIADNFRRANGFSDANSQIVEMVHKRGWSDVCEDMAATSTRIRDRLDHAPIPVAEAAEIVPILKVIIEAIEGRRI